MICCCVIADTMVHINNCYYNTGEVQCHYCLGRWSVDAPCKLCKSLIHVSYLNHINYKQLKVDKPHMNMSTTQGFTFKNMESQTAEVRFTNMA